MNELEAAQRIKKLKAGQTFRVTSPADQRAVIRAANKLQMIGELPCDITTKKSRQGGIIVIGFDDK